MENLNKYQSQAITTRIYPEEIGKAYVVFGLQGEVSELVEKLAHLYLNSKLNINVDEIIFVDEKDKIEIEKEIGDVFWYLAGIMSEFDFKFGDTIGVLSKDLEKDYKSYLISYDSFPFVLLNFCINVGKISEYFKKFLRDGLKLDPKFEKGNINLNRITVSNQYSIAILKEMFFLYKHLEYLLLLINVDLQTILDQNVEKLDKRKRENKLSGSGDNR